MYASSTPCGFHARCLAMASFGLVAAPPLQAHDFCVRTSTELQAALTAGSNGGPYNGEDNAIRVVQGIYLTGADGFHFYSTAAHALFLSGGFTDTSCDFGMKTENPLLAKLDGHGVTGVLSISSANGYIGVNTLTIQNGESGLGAGLQINYLATPNNIVAVSDVVVRNNHSNADAGGLYVTASATGVFLDNNLIVDNSADQQYAAGT